MPSLLPSSNDTLEKVARELLDRRKARENYLDFVTYNRPEYVPWTHHKILCDALMKVYTGKIRRLIVNMPPGHAKSEYVSRYFPPWYLGHRPNEYMILASYGQDLANDFGRDVRNIINDDSFPFMFPDLQIRQDSRSAKRWHTTRRGGYYAVGVGSALTGRRGNGAIIDDPFKDHKDAMSKLKRKTVRDWFQYVLLTRLYQDAWVILTQTRWHEDDLTGWLMKEYPDDWTVINLPAIATKADITGRKIGEALWEPKFGIKFLTQLKKDIGPRAFEALYQQNPSMEEGNIFLRKNWKFYSEATLPIKFQEILISMDTNVEEGADNDETAIAVLGKKGADYYLLDMVHAVMGFNSQIASLQQVSGNWKMAFKKLIEKKANGPAIQNLLKSKMSGMVMVEPQGSKVERAWAVEPLHIAGNLYVPSDKAKHPWVDEFIEQMALFPNADHDDMVDAFTQGINYWNGPNSAFLAKMTTM